LAAMAGWVLYSSQFVPSLALLTQERRFVFDAKFEDAHNIGMYQAGDSTSLRAKIIRRVTGDLRMQHFDCSIRAQVNVFAKLDLGETPFTKLPDECIVAKLLT
jgi:hypothetical protein